MAFKLRGPKHSGEYDVMDSERPPLKAPTHDLEPDTQVEMNVGLLIVGSREADQQGLIGLAHAAAREVSAEMKAASGIPWIFHLAGTKILETDEPRRPSDFIEDAILAMADQAFDAVVVITDVALTSRRRRLEPGLASPITRVAVVSTRKLLSTPRGEPMRMLNSEAVKWNAAILIQHLLGHICGLRHSAHGVMAPFTFDETRREAIPFSPHERDVLQKRSKQLPEREIVNGNALEDFLFHVLMAFRHGRSVVLPLARNRAPFLALSLPSLATAAVAPSLLLVFSAEIWDAGLGMSNSTAAAYATASILAASLYLVQVQALFFPRKEKRLLTEHVAVANVVIFLSILLLLVGLFFLVGALVLMLGLYVFPEDLMSTWPTLNQGNVGLVDLLRLSAFVATVGVTTGALAGGLESRTVIQHLALFENEP